MEFLGVRTNGFSRMDIFKCQMDDKGSIIVCGDHGDGKTDALQSVLSVLSKEEFASIDHPITKGKKRMEITVDLKVDPGDKITLMDHVFRADVGDNITVALVKTPSGSPELTLFNSTTGDQYKGTTTETRKIVDLFLGRFPDPHRLDSLGSSKKPSEREEFLKIVASMSKTKEGEPIDFTAFIEQEKEARENHATQKAHLKFLNDDQLLVPQNDWAKDKIDQKVLSDEIQKFNEYEKENERRLRVLNEAEKILENKQTELSGVESQKKSLADEINKSKSDLDQENRSIESLERMVSQYKENNPIVEPEDTEELTRKIEAIQEQLKKANDLKDKNQKIKDTITEQQNKAATRKQLAEQSEKTISEKQSNLDEVCANFVRLSANIPDVQQQIEKTKADNPVLLWTGEKDPEEALEVLPYLNSLMSKAVIANKQVADREKYEDQAKKVESTKKQMKDATDSINQIKSDERMVIESSVFPHPGIQIRRDDKDKVDVWVKDRHEVWNTYNDTNHAERTFQAVNIVTHGAGGDLKLLFVNEGYALLPYKRKQIIEAANRKGFKVMMEAFTAGEGENAIYLGEPVNAPKDPFPEQTSEAQIEQNTSGIPAFGKTE